MAEPELKDISIIGGGPTGLFAAFYAGMRGASARIIDALPALGGQLMALYPEKFVFDVAGFPKILAKDLVRDMAAQGLQFGATTHLGQVVTGLLYIDPEVCIDCGACEPACPVQAIFPADLVPEKWAHYTQMNADWYKNRA